MRVVVQTLNLHYAILLHVKDSRLVKGQFE